MTAVRNQGGDGKFPAEYASVRDAFETGDRLARGNELTSADKYYQLAISKCAILENELTDLRIRLAAEEHTQGSAARIERERLHAHLAPEESPERDREGIDRGSRIEPNKEKALPSTHTVKRGDTLPLIAGQPDIYSDNRLWPLIYRANRDQISDPKHIWPGQILRIPRNYSLDEMAEARRFSQAKPLR